MIICADKYAGILLQSFSNFTFHAMSLKQI